MMMKYIIVGKGASGKDWLQRRFIEKGYSPMKQYTTREIRDNESGDEYHFITEDEFNRMKNYNDFISSHFYRIGWYGVGLYELKKHDVSILSPANINDIFGSNPGWRKEFTIIYLDIPIEIRRERLSRRYTDKIGDDNEVRIMNDENDFKDFNSYDIRLTSVEEIESFINKLPKKSKK